MARIKDTIYLLDTHVAICEQMTIITADEDIAKYQAPHIW